MKAKRFSFAANAESQMIYMIFKSGLLQQRPAYTVSIHFSSTFLENEMHF